MYLFVSVLVELPMVALSLVFGRFGAKSDEANVWLLVVVEGVLNVNCLGVLRFEVVLVEFCT